MFKNIKSAADLAQEALQRENESKVADAKAFLVATDWIVTKLAETALEAPELLDDMRMQYATEMAERKASRDLINVTGGV